MDQSIAQFLEATQCNSPEAAKYYLELANGDVNAAVAMVYEDTDTDKNSAVVGKAEEAPQEMTILEWNIQGLLEDNLNERTVSILGIIKDNKPSALLLQEVVVKTYSYLKSALKDEYVGYSAYEMRKGSGPSYFTAIFVSKIAFASCHSKMFVFNSSQQGRDLLAVSGKCYGRDVTLLTSHLESTKPGREERKRQLMTVYKAIINEPQSHTVIFGGDTNLRDAEFNAVTEAGEFDTHKVNDVWNILDCPSDSQFSWDLLQNDNQVQNGNARLRFERLYMRVENVSASKDHFKPKSMKFVGTERLACGKFPSDHWGILTVFDTQQS